MQRTPRTRRAFGNINRRALALAKSVRMLVLDVDGVFTDGGLYFDREGMAMKRFNVQDGLGVKLAQAAGIEVAVITGLNAPAVGFRVKELGIEEYFAGRVKKREALLDICGRKGLELPELAYLGDDWVDLAPMELVGLPMAVGNAVLEVRRKAAWISNAPGGGGAVREAVRFILMAQNRLDDVLKSWS